MRLERGSFVVEAALVLPVLLLMLLAAIEVTAIARTQLQVVAAAREGARVAATVPGEDRAVQAVRTALGEDLGDRVGVRVSRGGVGSPARVTVRVRHRFLTPFWSDLGVTLSWQATMAVEL